MVFQSLDCLGWAMCQALSRATVTAAGNMDGGLHRRTATDMIAARTITKEGRREYAQAVGVAAAHNATEPCRVLTAVTNDAARSLGKRVAEHSGAAEHSAGQTLDISRDPSTGDLCIDVNDGGNDPRDADSHAGQSNNEFVSSIKTQSGDMETVAEGTHSAVKKDVILRLETLTVQETKYIMAVVWAAILIAFAALFTEFTVKVKWDSSSRILHNNHIYLYSQSRSVTIFLTEIIAQMINVIAFLAMNAHSLRHDCSYLSPLIP
ncbi:hypothetical protein WJX82_009238 [Trebouxia sp. C0006]